MNKIYSILGILAILVSLASCANEEASTTPDNNKTDVSTTIADNSTDLVDSTLQAAEAKIKKDSIEAAEKALAEAEAKKKAEEEKKKASINVADLPVSKPKIKTPKKTGPKIKFVKKNHNFGTITEGDVVKYEFEYTNTGDKDLIIKDASASCGCTAPGFSFFPLEPGQSSAISVSFNSKNKVGAQKPTVTIITNSYPSKHVLTMEGVVVK